MKKIDGKFIDIMFMSFIKTGKGYDSIVKLSRMQQEMLPHVLRSVQHLQQTTMI